MLRWTRSTRIAKATGLRHCVGACGVVCTVVYLCLVTLTEDSLPRILLSKRVCKDLKGGETLSFMRD